MVRPILIVIAIIGPASASKRADRNLGTIDEEQNEHQTTSIQKEVSSEEE